jgi:hypothetical protein
MAPPQYIETFDVNDNEFEHNFSEHHRGLQLSRVVYVILSRYFPANSFCNAGRLCTVSTQMHPFGTGGLQSGIGLSRQLSIFRNGLD